MEPTSDESQSPSASTVKGTVKRQASKRFSVIGEQGNPMSPLKQGGSPMAVTQIKVENISDAKPIDESALRNIVDNIKDMEYVYYY
jgi:hypothetical protein